MTTVEMGVTKVEMIMIKVDIGVNKIEILV